VKPHWQEDVKNAFARQGLNEKQFAKKVGCAQSTMHDLLNSSEASHSALVPAIHAALGWDPPPDLHTAPPLPSPDAIEMAHMFDRLPEELKKKLRDDAALYLRLTEAKD
jgi:hypothetical protein